MRRLLFALILLAAAATAALAQFPPPGAYACVDAGGAGFGTILLSPDGDYQFTAADGAQSKGQIASSGTDVQALTGPLADLHLAGSYATEAGATTFSFTSDKGAIGCRPAA
jgi:hypothetical protein